MTTYRDLFLLPDDFHYLNCAFMAPLSKRVNQAALDALQRRRLPAGYGVDDFFQPADKARELFAAILGCQTPSQIALIPSSSYGMAIVAKNIPANSSQSVVVVEEQFPSSINTWSRYSKTTGCKLKIVGRPSSPGDDWSQSVIDAIDSDTVIVCLPHVHWTDGAVFDLEKIGVKARSVDAKLIIDGTQSIGALHFDFDKIKPDAVICAAYKWLTANKGLGAMYLGNAFDEAIPLEENWIARANSRQFANLTEYTDEYTEGAARFDVGERGIALLLPIFVEALSQVNEWGTERIQTHCRDIVEDGLARLSELGFGIPAPDSPKHLFGIELPDSTDTAHVFRGLKERNISVSLRGSYIRVSPHLYNDRDDIIALVSAITELVPLETV